MKDHDHENGNYLGPSHNSCNLHRNNKTKKYKIPVIFHNLKGYDGNILISGISKHIHSYKDNFSVLASNNEKFISF